MNVQRLERLCRPIRRRRQRALLGLALLATVTAAVPPAWAGDLAAIRARGKLVMLCFANMDSTWVRPKLDAMREKGLKLIELRDPADFEGFDVDLMKSFAASLGLPLEIRSVTTSYADLMPALVAGQGDVVASSITITDERRKIVDFSDPYVQSWAVVAVPLNSQVRQLSDLAGKTGVAMRGSSQIEIFRRQQPPGTNLQLTDFMAQSYLAVVEGKADYLLTDADDEVPLGSPSDSSYPEVKVAIRLGSFDYGFAVRPGSDLRQSLNQWLAKAKASGEFRRIQAQSLRAAPRK